MNNRHEPTSALLGPYDPAKPPYMVAFDKTECSEHGYHWTLNEEINGRVHTMRQAELLLKAAIDKLEPVIASENAPTVLQLWWALTTRTIGPAISEFADQWEEENLTTVDDTQ